jgi:signal transduction histidine kinase
MTSALQAIFHPYPRLRRFAIDFALCGVFNLVIALSITYLLRTDSSLHANLIISFCIGWLAVTFIGGGRLLLWGLHGKPPKLPFLVLLIISLFAAQQLGNLIASFLLGVPLESLTVSRDAVRSREPIGYIVMTFLFGFSITWFFWNRHKLEQLKAEAEAGKARAAAIEKQAMQAQLQMLQAQIEPHMLFNTLANLRGLIGLDPARAQHMLDQLIQYLRATLSSSRSEKTSLAHEFALMQAYLGLMQVRMGSRLSYAFQIPEELHGAAIAPMLLQPLVENAIKHGLEPKIEGGHIDVRAARDGQTLVLTVTDSGLGLDALFPDKDNMHVGVANIRERLQALYGERASCILLPNTPSGVIAQLTLPL